MYRVTQVKALTNYRIQVKYSDGLNGEVDLSLLVGKGVFKNWEDKKFFEKVHIGEGGDIRWNNTIDICPDSIYMKISGKTPEELFPALKLEKVDA